MSSPKSVSELKGTDLKGIERYPIIPPINIKYIIEGGKYRGYEYYVEKFPSSLGDLYWLNCLRKPEGPQSSEVPRPESPRSGGSKTTKPPMITDEVKALFEVKTRVDHFESPPRSEVDHFESAPP